MVTGRSEPRRPHRPSSRRIPPLARAFRTLWLGLLLGLVGGLLVVATIALVQRPHLARLGPGLSPEEEAAVRTVLPSLPEGPEWRVAARIGTPWGTSVRLRPYAAEMEVRGADCVLTARHGEARIDARLEGDPAGVDWPRLNRTARDLEGSGAKRRLASLFADDGGGVIRPFFVLHDAAAPPWTLEAEMTVPGTTLTSWRDDIPWVGEPAGPGDGGERVDLRLTLDPATLEPLAVRDLRFRLDGAALVFDPNPVATSGRPDLRDGDEVDGFRIFTTVSRLDGSGFLRGTHVEVLTDRPPGARESSFFFAYPSADPRFEEAMAYVHADRALERTATLGFTGLFSAPLRLRVHGTAADNSWYSRPNREIVLGDGGVDDAEDADIILHELAHALHDALVPGFGDGDTRAISEGFADFWAASITGNACIGDWDATSYSPPCLRRVDEPAVWPGWLNGRVHHDGAIWSSLLWDLRARLGTEASERLALAALLEQDTGSSWTEAAAGLLRAAAHLGLDAELPEIREILADHGLGPRESSFSLVAGASHVVELLAPGRFADSEVHALVIQGDGRIQFLSAAETPLTRPFPEGPPCVAPCALTAASEALRLDGRLVLNGSRLDLELRWIDVGTEVARLDGTWESLAGWLEWEYKGASDQGASAFYAGASIGSLDAATLPSPSLARLPAGGVGGLSGFRTTLGEAAGESDLRGLLGARFRLESDADEQGRLRLRGVARPLGSSGAITLSVRPNPCRGPATIRLRLREAAPVSVRLFDALGRRVSTLTEREAPAGIATISWDGRDETGRLLPSGVYWIHAESAGGRDIQRLVVIR